MSLIKEDDDLPKLYETEDTESDEKLLLVRFYEQQSGWEWYLCEYDPIDKTAFGFVKGFESEWGYFSIIEMQEIPTIKRDHEFEPIRFKELRD